MHYIHKETCYTCDLTHDTILGAGGCCGWHFCMSRLHCDDRTHDLALVLGSSHSTSKQASNSTAHDMFCEQVALSESSASTRFARYTAQCQSTCDSSSCCIQSHTCIVHPCVSKRGKMSQQLMLSNCEAMKYTP
eukprot:20455-Heterococcus_DN1.PRE.8